MNSLTKFILIGLLCAVLVIVPLSGKPFTKYGRGCADIGCPSSQTCVLVEDACSFGQNVNRQCGSYPTCKRRTNTATSNTVSTLNYTPRNSTVYRRRNTGIVPPRPTQSRTYY